jgi:tRNA threonylcarbamoyladenosine biosynthesis protein TsaE
MSGASQRVILSESPEHTHRLGVRLGALLRAGDFAGLTGELGAGKTHLVRGVAEGAGVPASEVSSPSFAIVNSYRGRLPLYHADLYRLRDEDELYATGFFDLVGGEGALLVEWVDRIPAACPKDHLLLSLSATGDTQRQLCALAFGARHQQLLAEWQP